MKFFFDGVCAKFLTDRETDFLAESRFLTLMQDLKRKQLPDNPMQLFEEWYRLACECEQIRYPAAMSLATISPDRYPESRIVLLEHFDASGFYLFTDKRSRKGRSLLQAPVASLNFYWGPLELQICVQGDVAEAEEKYADEFFQRRPRKSQVTAWVSAQSLPVPDKQSLQRRMDELDRQFEGTERIPRPPEWQAYRVKPRRIEFWLARARRLHDRFMYAKNESENWELSRLAP